MSTIVPCHDNPHFKWAPEANVINVSFLRHAGIGFLMTIVFTGCCQTDFVVDTSTNDPVIFAPGVVPGATLYVPLEKFTLSCEEAVVKVGYNIQITLIKESWMYSEAGNTTVTARLEPDVALVLAKGARDNGYNQLLRSFKEKLKSAEDNTECELKYAVPNVAAASKAADVIQRHLPRNYSSMLRSAYNHRIWPESQEPTKGISIDLKPGMRLRLENSLPISPAGIGSSGAHPSSFAAPTYLYFHAFTGVELCDSGASPQSSHNNFLCKASKNRDELENKTYLSLTSGLARLGVMQYAENAGSGIKAQVDAHRITGALSIISKEDSTYEFKGKATIALTAGQTLASLALSSKKPASSLIDMFERTNVGEGARRYWRLWLPAQRNTDLSMGNIGDESGGSPENSGSTPLLFSAATLKDLALIDFGLPAPCDPPETTAWSCYSLHYRVVPIPEITISVNGERLWIPIGSTLLDVMAERLHDGFASPSYYFSSATDGSVDHDGLANEGGGLVTPLAHELVNEVKVSRYHQDGLHAITASELKTDIQVARFLRLQLMPGDEIKWQ